MPWREIGLRPVTDWFFPSETGRKKIPFGEGGVRLLGLMPETAKKQIL